MDIEQRRSARYWTRREVLRHSAAGVAVAGACAAGWPCWLWADEREPDLHGPPEERLGSARTQSYRVGLEVTAMGGPIGGLYATVPIPVDWPEQKVRLDQDEFSAAVKQVAYRNLDHRVRQMLVSIPFLGANETARAVLHLEIERFAILPPEDPGSYVLPKRIPKDARGCLGSGPLIETRSKGIRDQAKKWTREGLEGWQLVETICDWVRENINVAEGKPAGAAKALENGEGHYEDVTGLFVALCRAAKIPARMVWVPKSAYAEFMLADATGRVEWLPCRIVGQKEIGGISEYRPILQKGDEVKVPEKKEPQRFVAEFVQGKKIRGGGRPRVHFIRESN